MTRGFHFNLNKCVGCHACVAACQIENGPDVHVPWREISSFNSRQHPALPLFHYSLACNHCTEAPCMSSCPALAYTRDAGLDIVVHHADRCIGCKYCTWACPYDAPKFVNANGIVEKCTSCQHRLEEGKKPACANLCPTGALDYRDIERNPQRRIPGFTEVGIEPGIQIVRLRGQKPPRSSMKLDAEEQRQFEELEFSSPSKVTLKKEWVLVVFTLLVPSLTAVMASASLGWLVLNPYLFLAAGIAGLLLTTVHLGKKRRAWRAVLNVRNSWLSREILGYGLFLAASGGYILFPEQRPIGWIAALLGFFTSYSIDKIYLYFEKNTRLEIQSNSVFLTALLLTSAATYNEKFALLVLGLKFLLYLYRKLYFITHGRKVPIALPALRLFLGFILPVWLWFNFVMDPMVIISVVLAGELIDRMEFYAEAEVITPKRQIMKNIGGLLS